jgi:nitrate/TMAO reductase-like tetraheme cytochrome c subunit
MADESRPGWWQRLRSPSARWSVLSLVLIGLVVGAGAVIGTQWMVAVTGTNDFCGGACHSMQWVDREYKASIHYANRTGVRAECHDCHIPHDYPELLFYKARAGIKDVIGELRGVISTQEKFEKERLRMARHVWAEYKEDGAARCRACHVFTAESIKHHSESAQRRHVRVLEGRAVCTDCHKGVAHTEPEE